MVAAESVEVLELTPAVASGGGPTVVLALAAGGALSWVMAVTSSGKAAGANGCVG